MKKIIIGAIAAILVIIIGVFAWYNGSLKPVSKVAIEENELIIAETCINLNNRISNLEDKNNIIDNALQSEDIISGSANGTISVKGSDVVVKGLASAAYTEASAYATADQGAKADAAAPQATTYTKDEVDAFWVWEEL